MGTLKFEPKMTEQGKTCDHDWRRLNNSAVKQMFLLFFYFKIEAKYDYIYCWKCGSTGADVINI